MATLAAAALASDPELQSAARKTARRVMKFVDYTMTFGTAQDKIALAKAVMPNMWRQLAVVDEEQGAAAEAEAHARIRAAMGGDE
jgi:hypothetical protein